MSPDKSENQEIIDSIELSIPDPIPKERIDKYLAQSPELNLTRSKIQKLIKAGLITINGAAVSHNQSVTGGEDIVIMVPASPPSKAKAEDIKLDIRYEDDDLIVVNKPAGMVTHPAAGNYTGTLVNALLYHTGRLSSVQGEQRPGIVHRLDKNTSGLIVAAKNDTAHDFLQKKIQNREIKRTYRALICGHMKEESGIIDLPIGRSIKDRKKMIVTNLKSRQAITEFNLLDRFRLYDYVEINLETGRTHQIRVHFSHLGHPLLGDPDYGGRLKWHKGVYATEKILANEALKLINRQALHAYRLQIPPLSGQDIIDIEVDPPEDFQSLLDMLERDGR